MEMQVPTYLVWDLVLLYIFPLFDNVMYFLLHFHYKTRKLNSCCDLYTSKIAMDVLDSDCKSVLNNV